MQLVFGVRRLSLLLLAGAPPTIAPAQTMEWDLNASTIALEASAERVNVEEDEVLCEDLENVDPSTIEPSTYEASASCDGANASASVLVDPDGQFVFEGSVGAFASYPEVTGAVASLDCSFAFTVSAASELAIECHVGIRRDPRIGELRFALIGPSGPIMERTMTPLAWEEMNEDVSLAGALTAGEIYRLEISFLYDAWDGNAATVRIDDLRYDGATPDDEASWGSLKSRFRSGG